MSGGGGEGGGVGVCGCVAVGPELISVGWFPLACERRPHPHHRKQLVAKGLHLTPQPHLIPTT